MAMQKLYLGINVIDEKTIEVTTEEVNARSLRLMGGQILTKGLLWKSIIKKVNWII